MYVCVYIAIQRVYDAIKCLYYSHLQKSMQKHTRAYLIKEHARKI